MGFDYLDWFMFVCPLKMKSFYFQIVSRNWCHLFLSCCWFGFVFWTVTLTKHLWNWFYRLIIEKDHRISYSLSLMARFDLVRCLVKAPNVFFTKDPAVLIFDYQVFCWFFLFLTCFYPKFFCNRSAFRAHLIFISTKSWCLSNF